MCLYPKLIKNPKYKANKKNGGNIPAVNDYRVMAVPIGCGQCIECRNQKKREWQTRLLEHVRTQKNGHMVTLTFSTEALKELRKETTKNTAYEIENEIATIAIRRFTENWRKEFKTTIKHWTITELGGGRYEHLHIHGILWTDETQETIKRKWKYGWVWAGYKNQRTYVNEQTINYIIKYVTKIDLKHKHYKPKILCSKGIGSDYLKRTTTAHKNNAYTTRTGHKIALPIYYKNKIYTDEEKEQKWIEKLNEETRYILKRKIDISKNNDDYNNALKEAREYNEKMGYGNDKENWEERAYEEQRRTLLINKRLNE